MTLRGVRLGVRAKGQPELPLHHCRGLWAGASTPLRVPAASLSCPLPQAQTSATLSWKQPWKTGSGGVRVQGRISGHVPECLAFPAPLGDGASHREHSEPTHKGMRVWSEQQLRHHRGRRSGFHWISTKPVHLNSVLVSISSRLFC